MSVKGSPRSTWTGMETVTPPAVTVIFPWPLAVPAVKRPSVSIAPTAGSTRAELLAFITRVLGVDESAYYTVELPFADNTDIPNWAQNYVQAMYTLGPWERAGHCCRPRYSVLPGSERGGRPSRSPRRNRGTGKKYGK